MDKAQAENKLTNKLIWLVILVLSIGPYMGLVNNVRALLS